MLWSLSLYSYQIHSGASATSKCKLTLSSTHLLKPQCIYLSPQHSLHKLSRNFFVLSLLHTYNLTAKSGPGWIFKSSYDGCIHCKIGHSDITRVRLTWEYQGPPFLLCCGMSISGSMTSRNDNDKLQFLSLR